MRRPATALTLGSVALTVLVTTMPLDSPAAASASQNASLPPGRLYVGATMVRVDAPDRVVSMLPDGSDRRVVLEATEHRPWVTGLDVSSDGGRIAVASINSSFESSLLEVADTEGSNRDRILRGDWFTDPSFAPSGDALVFNRRHLAGNGPQTKLMRVKSDGTALSSLTQGAEPQPEDQSWSPDGKRIALIARVGNQDAIVLTDRLGTWYRFIYTVAHKRGALISLSWAPDSSTIIFARHRGETSSRSADVWTIRSDGTELTQVTDTPQRREEDPVYSPDGESIACILSPGHGSLFPRWLDVLVMDADGSNRTRIMTPNRLEFNVSWAVDPT